MNFLYLLWISLQDLKRILQGVEDLGQSLSSFSDSLWFTESSGKTLVLIDLVIELELERILRFSHQEITNSLWNRVLDASQNDSEVAIDSLSKFPNEDVSALSLLRWLVLISTAIRVLLSVGIIWVVLWLLTWRNDIGSSILVSNIICEKVVLLRVDDSLNNISSMVSLLGDNLNNNIHNFWNHSWESLENFVDDLLGNLFELLISILDEFKSRVSKLLKLGIDQIDEDIDGWETWKAITFMHLNGLLNMEVVIVLGSSKVFILLVKVIEIHFDPGTT